MEQSLLLQLMMISQLQILVLVVHLSQMDNFLLSEIMDEQQQQEALR